MRGLWLLVGVLSGCLDLPSAPHFPAYPHQREVCVAYRMLEDRREAPEWVCTRKAWRCFDGPGPEPADPSACGAPEEPSALVRDDAPHRLLGAPPGERLQAVYELVRAWQVEEP